MTTSSTRGVGKGPRPLVNQPLDRLSSVLGSIFSVELGVPQSVREDLVKSGKKFCVGLLESPRCHAWWPAVSRLGARERMSVSASLFLARKVLPSSPDPRQAEKHMALMGRPAPDTPSDYLDFIVRELDELFVVGWDKAYRSHVYSHTPTSSSCLEYSRRNGGARRFLAEMGADWFHDVCLDGDEAYRFPCVARYTVVETAGKMRGVTVSSGKHHVLGPLHRTLYDYLSQFGWLLRGEARGRKFRSFSKKKGEIFVSGDYESATDNLSLSVSELILSRILSRARFIPPGIKDFAMRSLRSEIFYPDLGRSCHQERGQLMGNFLSFPLLCLHNYLALRFSIPRAIPLKINGDDIVFRCRRDEFERWRGRVGAAGLTLSEGKTMVNSSFFSLNSAFFEGQSSGAREIPVVRLSMFFNGDRPSGDVFSRAVRGWTNEARRLVGALWLEGHKVAIQATGRSVGALGIPADNSQIHTAGLAPRESFYRGSFACLGIQENPVPPVPLDRRNPACDDWVFSRSTLSATVSGRMRARWDREHREVCAQQVWQPVAAAPNVLWDTWWSETKASGFEQAWLAWKSLTRRVHRMGVRLNIPLRDRGVPPKRGGQWVPRDELPAYLSLYPGVGAH